MIHYVACCFCGMTARANETFYHHKFCPKYKDGGEKQ